ncbi:NAD(P)/FAD-dependent oxidoreductase [Methanobrevibacter sp. TMH8]|uniref:FAD-dependent oxidoreductase n=1 Tax=Methanobrevibacter sp. TMH8 TaxID=2848611 RepID=UPI001CCFA15A|nr:NAD(P)/FAD-dependent oxidoreductase [Methanobrevibacter sp. TMH8]MBZ9570753.1 NAD(P)/FAD-dependent oxidoreductase [Methanobrevibacter sp. TMH8]
MKNIIIGAGPAGRLAGIELGKLGEETLLIEKNDLGGTCLNKGCMVICALNDIARFLNNKRQYEKLGLISGDIEISYEEIVNKIIKTQKVIHEIDYEENTSLNNEIIYGKAQLTENEVSVGGETWEWENLLIATGGNPFIPNIPGKKYGLTNEDILKLKKVPEKLNIMGGSVIAAEISNIYSSFGSEVNIIARSNFLSELDPEIKDYIVKNLLKNVNIYENTDTKEIQKNKIIVENNGETKEFKGNTFIATGRSPNSEIARKILQDDDFDNRGAIKVNDLMQTSNQNIYAAGDVTGGINLTPVARMEGILAARNMAGYLNKIEYNTIPQSIQLEMDVSFANKTNFDKNKDGNKNKDNDKIINENKETIDISSPGSAGPGGFWKVLTKDTGITKASFDSQTNLLESITAISPSSISDIAYISYLMRTGENISNFDEFVEVHPSTDVFFQIMKYI